MEAKDVMTTPVISVGADTSIEETAGLMLERRISAVPVVDASGRLQGIVSEGDLMRHSKAGTGHNRSWWLSLFADRGQLAEDYTKTHGLTAGDVMTRTVVTATESTPLDKIATLLERHHIKRVPIVRRGKVVGIVVVQTCCTVLSRRRTRSQDSGKGPRHPRPHPERARRSRGGQGLRQRRRHQRSGRALGAGGIGDSEAGTCDRRKEHQGREAGRKQRESYSAGAQEGHEPVSGCETWPRDAGRPLRESQRQTALPLFVGRSRWHCPTRNSGSRCCRSSA